MPVDWDALVAAPCVAILGDAEATFTRRGIVGAVLPIIFDREGKSAQLNPDGVPIAIHEVRFGVRKAAFPPGYVPRQGDGCSVVPIAADGARGAAVTWVVVNVEDDHLAMLKIILGGRSTAGDDRP